MRLGLLTEGRLALPLLEGFSENGCEAVHIPKAGGLNFDGCDYLLFYGPMAPIRDEIRWLRSFHDIPPVIFWYTEQMPYPGTPTWLVAYLARLRFAVQSGYDGGLVRWAAGRSKDRISLPAMGRFRGIGEMLALKDTGRLRLICAFTKTHTRLLGRLGLPAVELPIGYHPVFGERLSIERDIDVVFLGTTRDARRKKHIQRLEQEFGELGIRFALKDGSPQHGYCFDQERARLLNRSKIMLNLMRQPWDDPIFRALLAFSNGALLLSEPIWETSQGPLLPENHYAVCDLKAWVEGVQFYLSERERRESIAENAYEFMVQRLTMPMMVERLLGMVN